MHFKNTSFRFALTLELTGAMFPRSGESKSAEQATWQRVSELMLLS
jgi:hypothetical protein